MSKKKGTREQIHDLVNLLHPDILKLVRDVMLDWTKHPKEETNDKQHTNT